MSGFNQDKNEYLRPFWKGGKITNETVMFVGKEDVGVLLYKPRKIISVKNYFLDREYIQGKDYLVKDNKIYRLSDEIPFWQESEYYPTVFERYRIGANKEICDRLGGERFLKYGEGDTFTKMQIAVTYEHCGKWNGPTPRDKSEKFSRVLKKLKSGTPCKFLFYGDSISTGCNASGTPQGGNVPPYMPPFPDLVCEYVREKYGTETELINTSVGGMDTKWGLNNIEERVIACSPDLVFIGFGMNDPATPQKDYRAMITEMVEKTHKALPDADIMLLSSILPNNESDENWFANQRFFREDLAKTEKNYDFVGFADVTEMHAYILSAGKRYRDATANNINHPNDFGHRLYAQVILSTLLGEEFTL